VHLSIIRVFVRIAVIAHVEVSRLFFPTLAIAKGFKIIGRDVSKSLPGFSLVSGTGDSEQ